jgi:hypothetical protein
MKPYYYVFKPTGSAPKVRHDTLAKAQEEAERLATRERCAIEILRCVGIASCSKASTFWMDGEEPKEDPPEIQFFRNSAWDIFYRVDGENVMLFRDWVGHWQCSSTYCTLAVKSLQPIDESELPEDARQKLKEIEQ